MEQYIVMYDSISFIEKKENNREPEVSKSNPNWILILFNKFFSTGIETNKEKEK
jgi:hypothetical protein